MFPDLKKAAEDPGEIAQWLKAPFGLLCGGAGFDHPDQALFTL